MVQEDLPHDVQQLIADHITAVEQLEILLFLRQHPDQEWTVKRISEEIRTSERSASSRLKDLRAHGLIAARDAQGAALYRFEPVTDGLRRTIARLADAYAERRYTVIDLIFSKPIDRLRVYADAFRFRKGDADG